MNNVHCAVSRVVPDPVRAFNARSDSVAGRAIVRTFRPHRVEDGPALPVEDGV